MGRDTFGVPASQPWLLAGPSAALKATLCWVLNSKGVPFLAPQLGKYVCSPRRPLNRRQGRGRLMFPLVVLSLLKYSFSFFYQHFNEGLNMR